MVNLGIVTPVARGDWDSGLTYNILNIVKYNNATYMAKSTSTGVPPSSSASAWMKLVDNETPPATSTKAIGEIVVLEGNDNPHNLFGGTWRELENSEKPIIEVLSYLPNSLAQWFNNSDYIKDQYWKMIAFWI